MHEGDKSNLLRMMLGEMNREWRELSQNKPMPLLVMLPLLFTILATPAHSQTPTEPMRRTWELCQGGDLASCNRLLRLPIDDETRALVEIDRQQAIDRRIAICAGAGELVRATNEHKGLRPGTLVRATCYPPR